ncbi:MAG: hypothetical protein HQL19_03255 [Candidatus Omnitrophica bacterium]|nr:hypothetical protein [Candidatus Omnitrophota bacterium]
MSIFYDPHTRRPQVWTYAVFILITLGICIVIYNYGMKAADQKGVASNQDAEKQE